MEKCGHRSVIAYSARGYFCSMDDNLTMSLWRAVDQASVVLDVLVERRRNKQAAKRLLRKLLKRQMRPPRLILTDKVRPGPESVFGAASSAPSTPRGRSADHPGRRLRQTAAIARPLSPSTERDHPGMAAEIISERRARSNRNAGRHHRGFAGDFPRNPQSSYSTTHPDASPQALLQAANLTVPFASRTPQTGLVTAPLAILSCGY
jgi:hypothetical protein